MLKCLFKETVHIWIFKMFANTIRIMARSDRIILDNPTTLAEYPLDRGCPERDVRVGP